MRDTASKPRWSFQNILDHHCVIINIPLAALAHVELDRSQATNGDKDAARTAYQNSASSGKTRFPILKQTKAEYAKLK